MIGPIAFVLAISCPTTQLVGFDKEPTKEEQKSIDQAKKRCTELYPESPCLIKFEKREPHVFRATCGDKK